MKTSYKIWTNNVISEKKKDKEKKIPRTQPQALF